jgi:hypothetical protein
MEHLDGLAHILFVDCGVENLQVTDTIMQVTFHASLREVGVYDVPRSKQILERVAHGTLQVSDFDAFHDESKALLFGDFFSCQALVRH